MTFYNPQPRAMAGDFLFPLPKGATISGYALDIEGKMLNGVVDYFSDNAPTVLGPVTLQVGVFTNYDLSDEKRKILTVLLHESKDRLQISKVAF